MEMLKRNFAVDGLEVREDEAGGPVIVGHAAVFDSESHHEVIRPGAFTKTLKESKNIRALWNHDTSQPLASTGNGTLKLTEDERGLAFEMKPDLETTRGRDALQDIRSGLVSGMSFGFEIVKDTFTRSEDEDDKPPLREIQEVKLFEVSPVTFPWYEDTDASVKALRSMDEAGVDVRAFCVAVEARDRAGMMAAMPNAIGRHAGSTCMGDCHVGPEGPPRNDGWGWLRGDGGSLAVTAGSEEKAIKGFISVDVVTTTGEPGPGTHSDAGVAVLAMRKRQLELLELE